MIDALRCWVGLPRWVTYALAFSTYQVCAHCSGERGHHVRRLP
jgi:hypothetical protein